MAAIDFDLTNASDYIRSFGALREAVAGRGKGKIVELKVALPGGPLFLFLESSSLYIVGFRGSLDKVLVLDGGKEENYLAYFPAKDFGSKVTASGIPARYDSETWKTVFSKESLSLALGLPGQAEAGGLAPVKASIDRLAFAIAEAARFIPVRCAVACELAEDLEFKEVIARLVEWAGKVVIEERNVSGAKEAKDLSAPDAKLRGRLGETNMKVFSINQNAFNNLTAVQKWLAILNPDPNLTPEEKALAQKRASDLRRSGPRVTTLKLGDFRQLVTNWEKFSAIARTSLGRDDVNFEGLLSEFHVRFAASSVPAETSVTLAEWH